MQRDSLSASLLAELYDLEEDAYRLSIREAKRIGWGPPVVALRAVIAHASEALEELPRLAHERHVACASIGALALDTFRRLRDVLVDQVVDRERGYRRALTALRRSVDLVHLVRAAANDEGDVALASWCGRWLQARERLVADAAFELDWFGRHPFLATLPGAAFPLAA